MNRWIYIIFFLIFLLSVRVFILVSASFNNLAYIQFNRVMETAIWESFGPNKPDVMINLLETAGNMWPENYSAQRALGYIQLNFDNSKDTLPDWQNTTSMAEELIAWGKVEERKQNTLAASVLYEKAAKLNPNLADPWFFMGVIYEKEGNKEMAALQFQTGLHRSVFQNVGKSDLYFHMGKIAKTIPEKTINFYNQAVEINDFRQPHTEIQTRYSRGVALRWSGHELEAMNDFTWVLAHNPEHYWALVHQGALQWQVNKNAAEAEALMQQATAVRPELTWAYINLGQFYLDTKQNEKALEMYRQVIRLDPENETAIERLSQLLEPHGN